MTVAHSYGQNAIGQWVPLVVNDTDQARRILTSSAWSYCAPAAGVIDTSDIVFSAAPGGGKNNRLEYLQIINVSALIATEFVLKSNSTVIWRMKLPAAMVQPMVLQMAQVPFAAAANEALKAACLTAAVVYVNAQGYSA